MCSVPTSSARTVKKPSMSVRFLRARALVGFFRFFAVEAFLGFAAGFFFFGAGLFMAPVFAAASPSSSPTVGVASDVALFGGGGGRFLRGMAVLFLLLWLDERPCRGANATEVVAAQRRPDDELVPVVCNGRGDELSGDGPGVWARLNQSVKNCNDFFRRNVADGKAGEWV